MNRQRDIDAIDDMLRDGAFGGYNLPADNGLIAAGWERRCVTEAAKSREMAGSYAELGFEVRLVPVDIGSLCSSCEGCKDMVARFITVYVRSPVA